MNGENRTNREEWILGKVSHLFSIYVSFFYFAFFIFRFLIILGLEKGGGSVMEERDVE